MPGDQRHHLVHSGKPDILVIGDFTVELFFNGHDEHHRVDGVGTEVLLEPAGPCHRICFEGQHMANHPVNPLGNRCRTR